MITRITAESGQARLARARRQIASARVDRAALEVLSASSIPRSEIIGHGFVGLFGSMDLFRVGYFVCHWYHVGERRQLLEYRPRLSDLPRLTADTYERQVAVHRALGLAVFGRGEPYRDLGEGQLTLFGAEVDS